MRPITRNLGHKLVMFKKEIFKPNYVPTLLFKPGFYTNAVIAKGHLSVTLLRNSLPCLSCYFAFSLDFSSKIVFWLACISFCADKVHMPLHTQLLFFFFFFSPLVSISVCLWGSHLGQDFLLLTLYPDSLAMVRTFRALRLGCLLKSLVQHGCNSPLSVFSLCSATCG